MQPMRQGDVLLIPRTAEVQYDHYKQDHLVLALGEATGHKHQISNGQAELYKRDGTLYLRVLSEFATLSHEEHHALQIPQGDWVVRIQREYEPTGWHPVAD
ncbi:hypothetical protein [Planktothrix paucivesiculata]|uniref:Uncharacterized protein n=1 Tax=Planktothrix paucivesiculata PCC 9631 TaxID=671071 RepID=A0A7Z9E1B3_9CYAN|nr:hypothetical protein [Planktothrix paucivesiculata]VXD22613.1 conserved hypothetical protein [Planktothrix paucivesiculata PCC 9631]